MKLIVPIVLLVPFVQAKEQGKTQWFEKMEIGQVWMNTFGDYHQGQKRVGAIKGISLDFGDDWRVLFDTETLRVATVFQGGIEWGGTPWNGRHGTLVTLMNKDAPLLSTTTGCG